MTDTRIEEHEVGDDIWLLDPLESGQRTRWLRSDVYVPLEDTA